MHLNFCCYLYLAQNIINFYKLILMNLLYFVLICYYLKLHLYFINYSNTARFKELFKNH
jgi:hypothetical protein